VKSWPIQQGIIWIENPSVKKNRQSTKNSAAVLGAANPNQPKKSRPRPKKLHSSTTTRRFSRGHGLDQTVQSAPPQITTPLSTFNLSRTRREGNILLEEEFEVSGLRYRLLISNTGNVAFGLIGGASRKGPARKRDLYNLFPDEPRIDDCALCANGFTVLLKVKKLVLDWVYRTKPWRVSFSAATGLKFAAYRRIALRDARNLKDYHLEIDGNTFTFYRLASRQAA
jgi:hypothetical protein